MLQALYQTLGLRINPIFLRKNKMYKCRRVDCLKHYEMARCVSACQYGLLRVRQNMRLVSLEKSNNNQKVNYEKARELKEAAAKCAIEQREHNHTVIENRLRSIRALLSAIAGSSDERLRHLTLV